MKNILLATLLSLALSPALAQTDDCKPVVNKLEQKLLAEGRKNFYLAIVAASKVGKETVVGDCDDGKRKIVYRRA